MATKRVWPELPPPPAERFFKIRSKETGLFKKAGIGQGGGGWSKLGKTFNQKTLAGHLALFKQENVGWRDGPLPRPELEKGAEFYAIPAEYEVVEYFALGDVKPLKTVMRAVLAKGAVISHPDA